MESLGPDRRRGERGHLMAGLVASIAIMLIFSTMTFQAWEEVLRRDNEAEMIFRAREIIRAIHRYQKDHGGQAPTELKTLIEPGPRGQYYLRHAYKDPLVKGGGWGLLYIGPGGQILDPTAETAIPGLEGIGGLGNEQQKFAEVKRDPQADQFAQAGAAGAVGGMQIAGVKSLATDRPFRIYQGFTEYSQWLFTYLDVETALAGVGGSGVAQPGGARPGGNQGGFGSRVPPGGFRGRNQPGGGNPNDQRGGNRPGRNN